MQRMILRGVLAGALAGLLGASAPAIAQIRPEPMRTPYHWDWVGPNARFAQPVYLVQCTGPCPGDGLMLVPDPRVYRPGALRPLGGPYNERWEVEEDRNRLAADGLPFYALRVHVFDPEGDEVGAFWLGARPECGSPNFADGPLTGDVNADFSPRQPDGRPQEFALPFELDHYLDWVAALRPGCDDGDGERRPLASP